MEAIDYLRDDDNDLLFINGDLAIGGSEGQHIEDILICGPGEIRQFPLLGFKLTRFVKSPNNNVERFKRDLTVQLELDGYEVNDIDVENGLASPTIDAERA